MPLLALSLFGVYFMYSLFDCRFIPGDEGVATQGAWRIVEGQLPHRDFFEVIPPFSFLPTAVAFQILGSTFRAERLVVFLYGVTLLIAGDRLLVKFTDSVLARSVLLSVLIPFGVYTWPVPSHHWVVDIVQLLAILALMRALGGDGSLPWAITSGVLTALGCFSLQDQGAYLVVALLLIFFPLIRSRPVRRALFFGWTAGGFTVATAFALYLLPGGSLEDLLDQWVVHLATSYKGLPGNTGSLTAVLSEVGSPQWRAGLAEAPAFHLGLTGLQLLLLVLPLVTGIVIFFAALRRWSPREHIAVLGAACAAFFGASLHRYALINVIWASPPLLIAFAWGIGRLSVAERRASKVFGVATGSVVIGLGLAYATSILALTHGDRMITVKGTAGELRTVRGSLEASYGPIIEAVEELVPADAPLFATGFNPLINFWTQRENPTRYNFIVQPGYHREHHAEEVIATLKERPETYVVLFLPVEPGDLISDYVLRTYRPIWSGSMAALMAPPGKAASSR